MPSKAPNMKLESWQSDEERQRFKLMRTDNCADVGEEEIFAADEETGVCTVKIAGETKVLDFGQGGIRILRKGR